MRITTTRDETARSRLPLRDESGSLLDTLVRAGELRWWWILRVCPLLGRRYMCTRSAPQTTTNDPHQSHPGRYSREASASRSLPIRCPPRCPITLGPSRDNLRAEKPKRSRIPSRCPSSTLQHINQCAEILQAVRNLLRVDALQKIIPPGPFLALLTKRR